MIASLVFFWILNGMSESMLLLRIQISNLYHSLKGKFLERLIRAIAFFQIRILNENQISEILRE